MKFEAIFDVKLNTPTQFLMLDIMADLLEDTIISQIAKFTYAEFFWS